MKMRIRLILCMVESVVNGTVDFLMIDPRNVFYLFGKMIEISCVCNVQSSNTTIECRC